MRHRPITGPLLVLAGGSALAGRLAADVARDRPGEAARSAGRRRALRAGRRLRARRQRLGTLGPPLGRVLLLAVIVAAIALGALGLTPAGARRRMALGAIAAGTTGSVLTLLHIVGEPQPRDIVDVRGVAWLGLVCCVVVLAGGALWWDRLVHAPPRA